MVQIFKFMVIVVFKVFCGRYLGVIYDVDDVTLITIFPYCTVFMGMVQDPDLPDSEAYWLQSSYFLGVPVPGACSRNILRILGILRCFVAI